MSQAKVDWHKEQKLHRKETVKKQRRNRFIAGIAAIAICAAAVVWIGGSFYSTMKTAKEAAGQGAATAVTPVDLTPITDYTSSIQES